MAPWLSYQIQTRFHGREAIHSAILSDPDNMRSYSRMTWPTLTLRGPKSKVPTCTRYLACCPEEGDSLSVVAVKKIVTPRPDDLAPDTFCKIKGLEKYPCKVVALGTEGEVTAVLNECTGVQNPHRYTHA